MANKFNPYQEAIYKNCKMAIVGLSGLLPYTSDPKLRKKILESRRFVKQLQNALTVLFEIGD